MPKNNEVFNYRPVFELNCEIQITLEEAMSLLFLKLYVLLINEAIFVSKE